MRHIRYDHYKNFDVQQLTINGGITEESLAEILKGDYQALWLYSGDFTKLCDYSDHMQHLRVLRIQSDVRQDVSWISKLNGLVHLSISGNVKGYIDFTQLKNLDSAEIEYSPATKDFISTPTSVKGLLLSKCKVPLTEMNKEFCESIHSLNLTSGSFESITGLRKFKNLKSLVLMDIRNLVDISELTYCKQLEVLDITCCNKVVGVEVISILNQLREFTFENKSLPSLSLIPNESLEVLSLGESTIIEDRNVEILADFPVLKRAIFTKKKGYKYSALQLQPLLADNN